MSKTIDYTDNFGHKYSTRVAKIAGEDEIVLDTHIGYGGGKWACINIPADKAREIANAILEAVGPAPEPARPVHPDWDSIKIGDYFGYFREPDEPLGLSRLPYKKLSDTSYSYGNEIRHNAPEPESASRLKVAPLTFEDLEIGEKFSIGDDTTRVKINRDEYRIIDSYWRSETVFPKSYMDGCKLERVQ